MTAAPWLDKTGMPTFDFDAVYQVLIALLPADAYVIGQNGRNTLRVHGTIITGTSINLGHVNAFYCALTDLTMYTPSLTRIAGAVLVGNLRHNFNVSGDNMYTDFSMTKTNEPCDLRDFFYDYSLEQRSLEKITQHHHLHVRVKDLFNTDRNSIRLHGASAILAAALDRYNDLESTHATFWLYFKSARTDIQNIFARLLTHYGDLHSAWLKREGMWAKQVHGHAGLDLTQLFELNVLVNRLETQVDWESEKTNRTQPRLVTMDYQDVYDGAKELFHDAMLEGVRPYRLSYNDYWLQRSVIMPTGSVHSQDFDDRMLAKAVPYALRNKKGFFSAMPTSITHCDWLERKREINAYTSTKYEWGKVRALYGCDVTSHLHADFGLQKCEETFPSYVPTGSKATEGNVSRIMSNLKTLIPFCYDYDDFNSQHSFTSMKAVIDAWLSVFGEGLTREQVASVMWTRDSIDNQYVHCSQTGDEYQTTGTLFSGWRLTSFMNTALNYIYLKQAGLRKYSAYSLHNGDDVLAMCRTLAEPVALLRATKQYNIRAQATKMNIGTIGEFLRMDMMAKKTTAQQYLTRACSTCVHSRIESGAPTSMRAVVKANYDRAMAITERGGRESVAQGILTTQ